MLSASISALLGIALAIAGIVLICKGITWDRSRGRPRCAKCWYLLIGLPELRCPECGWRPKREGDVHKTRRSWRVACIGSLVCVLPIAHQVHRHWSGILHAVLPQWKLKEELNIDDFLVRLYEDRWEGTPQQVRIWQGSEQVLVMNGWMLLLGGESRKDKRTIGVGDDITGEGVPDLIIQDFSGGMHCCSNQYIFELNAETGIAPLSKLEGLHADFTFEDIDGDGCWEAIGWDWAFAYWNTCFAGSPAPDVILRYRLGRFVVAPELMHKPQPSVQKLNEMIRKVKFEPAEGEWEYGAVPVEYWTILLDLLYSENEATAKRFAFDAWGSDAEKRDKFLGEFKEQLHNSAYWPELRSMMMAFDCEPPLAAGESLISTAPCLGTDAE